MPLIRTLDCMDTKRPILISVYVVIVFPLLTLNLLHYYYEVYVHALSQYSIFEIWPANLRLTFRFLYLPGLLGLWFMKKWGVYLFLGAWLLQLIPSTIFSLTSGSGLDMGHLSSFVQFVVSLAVILPYWGKLQPNEPPQPTPKSGAAEP